MKQLTSSDEQITFSPSLDQNDPKMDPEPPYTRANSLLEHDFCSNFVQIQRNGRTDRHTDTFGPSEIFVQ